MNSNVRVVLHLTGISFSKKAVSSLLLTLHRSVHAHFLLPHCIYYAIDSLLPIESV
jgi:hypothetical protein